MREWGSGIRKIADWVCWPVRRRRQWLQRCCQSEIDIARVEEKRVTDCYYPGSQSKKNIKRSQHSASEDQPHDFVAGRGSMQCLVLAHHNNRPRTEHVEEEA